MMTNGLFKNICSELLLPGRSLIINCLNSCDATMADMMFVNDSAEWSDADQQPLGGILYYDVSYYYPDVGHTSG